MKKTIITTVFLMVSIFGSNSVFAGNYNYTRHSTYDFTHGLISQSFNASAGPYCNVAITPDTKKTTGYTIDVVLRRENALGYKAMIATNTLHATVSDNVKLQGFEEGEYDFKFLPGESDKKYAGRVSFNCTW